MSTVAFSTESLILIKTLDLYFNWAATDDETSISEWQLQVWCLNWRQHSDYIWSLLPVYTTITLMGMSDAMALSGAWALQNKEKDC